MNELDFRLTTFMTSTSIRAPRFVTWMQVVTHTGDGPIVAGGLLIMVALWHERGAALVATATAVAFLLSTLVKRVCQRTRPPLAALTQAPDRFSMPSGHASCAWALALALGHAVPLAAMPAMAWAGAVSLSRVVLGVHYVFDVAVGAILGVAVAAVTILAMG
jgi:undecaprenyl-diphosphatase